MTIRNLLSGEVGDALHSVQVYYVDNNPSLTRWQAALVDKLNRDAEAETMAGIPDEPLTKILRSVLSGVSVERKHGSLEALQSLLFAATG